MGHPSFENGECSLNCSVVLTLFGQASRRRRVEVQQSNRERHDDRVQKMQTSQYSTHGSASGMQHCFLQLFRHPHAGVRDERVQRSHEHAHVRGRAKESEAAGNVSQLRERERGREREREDGGETLTWDTRRTRTSDGDN